MNARATTAPPVPAPRRLAGRALAAWAGLLLAIAPAVRALNPAEKPSNYVVANWDTETGLPHNAVKAIFQTSDGYLWAGTQQGLARFDGITFTIFNQHNTPALLNSQITRFAETSDGSLWIGTSYGLVRYHHGRFRTYLARDGVKSATGTINALQVAADGSLWIGSQDGITRWADERFFQDVDTSAYDTHGMRGITMDREKAMWVVCSNYVLRIRDGKCTAFDRTNGLTGRQLQSVVEDPAGVLYVTSQSGLYRFDNDRFTAAELNPALSSVRIDAALSDRAGNFWIGTVGGLDRFVNGKVVPYTDRFGNRLGVVDALFEDRENCLWVGTSTGLYRLTDRRGYSLSREDGISGTSINCVVEAAHGDLWIAGWGGGADRFFKDEVSHFRAGSPLAHDTVTCVYESPDGTMWLGNRVSSIDRLDGRKATTFVYEPGVATSRPVTAIHADPGGGEMLIGISKRGLLTLKDGRIQPVPEAASLAPETVWCIHRLRNGRLLIGTSAGLFEQTENRAWQPVDIPGVPGPIVVRELLEAADGTIWLATDGHGLVRWRNGTGTAYDAERGLVDDTLFSVCDDGLGAIWVSSARGIARIREAEFAELDRNPAATLNGMVFGRDDGLLSGSTSGNGSPCAVRLKDGRLMFATDVGVAVIDPRRLQSNARPPTVVIEKAVADDRVLPTADGLVVPAGTNRLAINFTALSLVSPHRLRFRYQLQGSDPAWIEAGHERQAIYTHLEPGRYTFRVLACNNDGVWNDTGASLRVEMQPRFYQTLAFRVGSALALVAALFGLVGWRVRQLKAKQLALARTNAELDQRVRERTAELSRTNQELERRESLFRLIFEHAPVGISWHRTDLGGQHHLNSAFRRILDLPSNLVSDGAEIARLVHPDDAPKLAELDARIQRGELDSYSLEQRFVRRDGTQIHGLYAMAVVRDDRGQIVQVIAILEDITARKVAEQELAKTYKRLMEVSRVSGMAEVATGVLHNVGNVLNSVNVSVSVLADGLRQSKVSGLAKLSSLLQEHASSLGTFLNDDPKGQRVLPYLSRLAEHLQADHEKMVGEIEALRANIEHIKEIVARQQNLARQGGLLERISPVELLDDAVEMNAMALARHSVELVREISETPLIVTERHKVLQILINLIQNAKEALKAGRAEGRRLVVRISSDGDRVRYEVEDNGIGIEPENLTRIFEHGFTTRANGHGFGLHSSAIAAKQMGGALTARSAGIGHGAAFILELPIAGSAAIVADFTSPAGETKA